MDDHRPTVVFHCHCLLEDDRLEDSRWFSDLKFLATIGDLKDSETAIAILKPRVDDPTVVHQLDT